MIFCTFKRMICRFAKVCKKGCGEKAICTFVPAASQSEKQGNVPIDDLKSCPREEK